MASYTHIWIASIAVIVLVGLFIITSVNNPPTANNNVTVSQVSRSMPAACADEGGGGLVVNRGFPYQFIQHTCEEWDAIALEFNNTEWSCERRNIIP